MMHSGIIQAREFDDPPGLHEKTEYLLREWVNLYHSPAAGLDSTKAFSSFVAQVHITSLMFWSQGVASLPHKCQPPSPPLDNIRVMLIVWRLRGNIIRTAPCRVVWHRVHSQQHNHVSNSYRSADWVCHIGTLTPCMYYCNMVEWCWWDSSLIWKTNWFPSVLWHCWFGHMTCKNRPRCDL